RRSPIDAEPAGQLISGLEADAPDIGRQTVGILAHKSDCLVAVSLVNADRPGRPDTVGLQEHHDRPHRFLLLPALANALQPAWADALDLLEKSRALVDDVQRPGAEDLDDLVCIVRTDALDEA